MFLQTAGGKQLEITGGNNGLNMRTLKKMFSNVGFIKTNIFFTEFSLFKRPNKISKM